MAVREQDRVDAPDVVGQRLRAEVGGRVDENRTDRLGERRLGAVGLQLDENRRPRPAIAGIGRAADRAVAPDGRHAVATCRCPAR